MLVEPRAQVARRRTGRRPVARIRRALAQCSAVGIRRSRKRWPRRIRRGWPPRAVRILRTVAQRTPWILRRRARLRPPGALRPCCAPLRLLARRGAARSRGGPRWRALLALHPCQRKRKTHENCRRRAAQESRLVSPDHLLSCPQMPLQKCKPQSPASSLLLEIDSNWSSSCAFVSSVTRSFTTAVCPIGCAGGFQSVTPR